MAPVTLTVEIYRDRSRRIRTRVKSRNGNILFDCGYGYKRKAGARKAVDRLRGAQFKIKDLT